MKLTVSNTNLSNSLSTYNLSLANIGFVETLTLGNVSLTPTSITVGNVSLTPTSIGTPTLIVGGVPFSGGLQSGIIDYQEFTANGIWYNPYANLSVNSYLTGYEQVLVMAWGGGGGGNTSGGAGGGGSCVIFNMPINQMSNTCAVTVGSGGSGTVGAITAGGNSVFVINSTATVTAYGGGLGGSGAGGGGGTLGVGTTSDGGGPLGGLAGTPGATSTYGGGGGVSTAGAFVGGNSVFGGGGGARSNNTSGATGNGGSSVYGGGGGSSLSPGGLSVFGGRGANGSVAAGIPGGGGSGNTNNSSGARGEVRVWTFGPAGTTAGLPTYALTANTTSLYEGSSVLYTVSTTNVPNGTPLYYTLNNSSTAVAIDFTNSVNGSVIINGGTGTFTLTSNADADFTNETIQMDVRTGSTTGSIVASNGSVSIIPRVDGVYNGFLSINDDGLLTSTWSNAPIGTALSTRKVAVLVYQRQADGLTGINTANTVTVGGVSAALVVSRTDDTRGHLDIWLASVPTGTSANIAVTWNNKNGDGKTIASYSLYGANSTAYSTGSNRSGGSSVSANVNIINGGYVIGFAGADSGDDRATTFTAGVNTDENGVALLNGVAGWGSIATTTTQSNYTVSAITDGGGDMLIAVASFQPG